MKPDSSSIPVCQPSTSSSTTPGASPSSHSPAKEASDQPDIVRHTPVRSYVLPREDSSFQPSPDPSSLRQSSGSNLRRRSKPASLRWQQSSNGDPPTASSRAQQQDAAEDADAAQPRLHSQAWPSHRATASTRSSGDLDAAPLSAAELAASSPTQHQGGNLPSAARPAALYTAPSDLLRRRSEDQPSAGRHSRQAKPILSPTAAAAETWTTTVDGRSVTPEQLHSARAALKAAQAHAIHNRGKLKAGHGSAMSGRVRRDDSAREHDTVRYVAAKLHQQNMAAVANVGCPANKAALLSNQSTVASVAGSQFPGQSNQALFSQQSSTDLDLIRFKNLRANISTPAIHSAPSPAVVPASYRAAAYFKSGATLSGRKPAPFIKGDARKGMPDATYFGLDCLELGPQITMNARERTQQWVDALELPSPTKKLSMGAKETLHSSSFPPASSSPKGRPNGFRRLFGCLAF